MKNTLKQGLSHEFIYRVPENKTVPHLYPEASEFQEMPRVLATGFLVGLIEWTCIQAIHSHIDWPAEQTVGTSIHIQHMAATPPGCDVTVNVRLLAREERKLTFAVEASDNVDTICKGTHERFVINAEKFAAKIAGKIEQTGEH